MDGRQAVIDRLHKKLQDMEIINLELEKKVKELKLYKESNILLLDSLNDSIRLLRLQINDLNILHQNEEAILKSSIDKMNIKLLNKDEELKNNQYILNLTNTRLKSQEILVNNSVLKYDELEKKLLFMQNIKVKLTYSVMMLCSCMYAVNVI